MSLPPNRNLFKEYPNEVGVETGTYKGDGIAAMIEAGIKEILSIDIKHGYQIQNLNVSLFVGDSAKHLLGMIEPINEKITFWLDAHYQGEGEITDTSFPLLEELKQIARHKIKTHTIIIDDWYMWEWYKVPYTREDVLKEIRNINPDYKITFVDNPTKDGILIASL
jgi:hypothetical protein